MCLETSYSGKYLDLWEDGQGEKLRILCDKELSGLQRTPSTLGWKNTGDCYGMDIQLGQGDTDCIQNSSEKLLGKQPLERERKEIGERH
jgi:hypothetical protein